MNQPNKQSLIAMIEAYAASKAEVALESNRPDQDCGYSLLQKEKKCVENKESLFNFIDKLNLDLTPDECDMQACSGVEDAQKWAKEYWLNNNMPHQFMEVECSPNDDDERLYFPTERCEPSEDPGIEYNYDTDNDPLISM
jgi:hypothetical protein